VFITKTNVYHGGDGLLFQSQWPGFDPYPSH
jgi:hypothetical protein